jgi:hypothetical protein
MAWKNAAYAAVSVRWASSKSRTGAVGEEDREHRAGACTTCGDAGRASASAAAP